MCTCYNSSLWYLVSKAVIKQLHFVLYTCLPHLLVSEDGRPSLPEQWWTMSRTTFWWLSQLLTDLTSTPYCALLCINLPPVVCVKMRRQYFIYRLVGREIRWEALTIVLSNMTVISPSSIVFCCRSKTGRASTNQQPFQYQDFNLLIILSTSSVGWLVKSSELLTHGEFFTFVMLSVRADVWHFSSCDSLLTCIQHYYCKITRTLDSCGWKGKESLYSISQSWKRKSLENRLSSLCHLIFC